MDQHKEQAGGQSRLLPPDLCPDGHTLACRPSALASEAPTSPM